MKKFLMVAFFLPYVVYSQEDSSKENLVEENKEESSSQAPVPQAPVPQAPVPQESSLDPSFLSLFLGMGFVSGEVPAAAVEKASYGQSYTFLEQEVRLSLWHFSSFSLGMRAGVMSGFASSSQMEKGQASGFFGVPLQVFLGYTKSSFQTEFLLGYFYHTHFIPNTSLSSSFLTVQGLFTLDLFSTQSIKWGIQGFGKFGMGSYASEASAFIPLKERLQSYSNDDSAFVKEGDATFFSLGGALRASYQKMTVALGYERYHMTYSKLFYYKYKEAPSESVFSLSGFHVKTQFNL